MAGAFDRKAPANLPKLPLTPSSRRLARLPSRVRCATNFGGTWPYWAVAEAEIDAHLAAWLPKAPPPLVRDPMLRLLSAAPPTMAPVLSIAACELVGGRRELALGAACALRLVHSAFCAHRSLLGLPIRPGQRARSADVALRDGVELLSSSGLLALAYQVVADSDAGDEPGRALRVVMEIASTTGPRGMVEGQHEEILCRQSWGAAGGVAEAEWLERVCRKGEGVLYACAAACGAILGGARAEETERLRGYGMHVGMLHGFLYGGGGEGFAASCREKTDAVAGELRSLALLELEGFQGDKKDTIAGLVDVK